MPLRGCRTFRISLYLFESVSAVVKTEYQCLPYRLKAINTSRRQRRSLYHNKGVKSSRRCNNHKYLCPHIEAPKYIKQMLMELEGEVNSNTIIVRNFNTPLSIMDKSSRQRIDKETADGNNTTDQ